MENEIKEKRNIFNLDTFKYLVSIALIIFSLMFISYLKYSTIFIIIFGISICPILYKKIANKKIRIILEIILPLIIFLIGSYNIINYINLNNQNISVTDEKRLSLHDLSNCKGKYEYIATDNDGVNYIYNLEVYDGTDGLYYADLEVIKNKTNYYKYKLIIDESSINTNLIFNFYETIADTVKDRFKKGDYLFRINIDKEYKTYWVKNIIGIFNDGNCFSKVDEFTHIFSENTEFKYKNNETIYFYKNVYSDNYTSYDSSNETMEQYKKNHTNLTEIIGEYTCNDICNVFEIDNSGENVTIQEGNDNIFVYNIKNKSKINLNLTNYNIHNVSIVKNKKNKVLGVIISRIKSTNEYEYNASFYNIELSKEIIEYYDEILYDDNSLDVGGLYCINGKWNDSFNSKLVSIYDGTIIRNRVSGSISNENVIYYYFGQSYEDTYIEYLYDKDFNLVYEAKTNDELLNSYSYHLNKNGNLAIISNNKFIVYDTNYKIKFTSNKYNNIYNIFENYIVVNNNGNLTIIDYEENEKAKLCSITDKMYVHYMLSGFYEDKGKNGIFVVVGDPDVDFNEIDKDTKESWGITSESDIQNYKDMLGYEYYYVPETGEVGKFATLIGGYAKPVLYLYPEKDNTLINIKFDKPMLLTTTYPKYNNEWNVIANKNGDLKDKNDKNYYALYWEEEGSTIIDFNTGFYVTKDNAIDFLEEKLEQIGLNERESNEFIMYWLPVLEKNGQSLVYFELTNERQKYNRLNINPKVDSLLRVAIHVKKVSKRINIKEQHFNKFERKGFVAVEWGGTIH